MDQTPSHLSIQRVLYAVNSKIQPYVNTVVLHSRDRGNIRNAFLPSVN